MAKGSVNIGPVAFAERAGKHEFKSARLENVTAADILLVKYDYSGTMEKASCEYGMRVFGVTKSMPGSKWPLQVLS